MTPQLKQYLNRSILVSIPALYEDVKCRTYTLRGFETYGLWLNSQELVDRLLHESAKPTIPENPVVFVPFAQIAGIVFATVTPTTPSQPVPGETPAVSKSPPPTDDASKTVNAPTKSSKSAR